MSTKLIIQNDGCGCGTPVVSSPNLYECCPDTTAFQLDFGDVIYHKNNSKINQLDGLGLNNGATLELVIEVIDEKIKGLNFNTFTLPYLRTIYFINTSKQFAESVDTELGLIRQDVDDVLTNSQTPLTATDSATIDFTTSGALNHAITASVKISPQVNNLLQALSDGLFSTPQTLSVNYTTKELTISNSNTVSLASLVCGASGFLGNVTADPVSIDGQYWFNTAQNKLKIKLNNTVREIPLV